MSQASKPVRLPDIAAKIYDLLDPLESSDRTKVLQGVLGLLGASAVSESPITPAGAPSPSGLGSSAISRRVSGPKAQAWLRKHLVTDEQLERVFHFDGKVELIATPPGGNKREQTVNAYILLGLQHLLQDDEPKFSEEAAVDLCKRLGCYDSPNHAQTRTKFGNRVTGSKASGFTLTVPGLDEAANLVKTFASAGSGKR